MGTIDYASGARRHGWFRRHRLFVSASLVCAVFVIALAYFQQPIGLWVRWQLAHRALATAVDVPDEPLSVQQQALSDRLGLILDRLDVADRLDVLVDASARTSSTTIPTTGHRDAEFPQPSTVAVNGIVQDLIATDPKFTAFPQVRRAWLDATDWHVFHLRRPDGERRTVLLGRTWTLPRVFDAQPCVIVRRPGLFQGPVAPHTSLHDTWWNNGVMEFTVCTLAQDAADATALRLVLRSVSLDGATGRPNELEFVARITDRDTLRWSLVRADADADYNVRLGGGVLFEYEDRDRQLIDPAVLRNNGWLRVRDLLQTP